MSEVSRQKDSSGRKSPYYGTKVDVEKSKTQIRDLLMKYGVSQQRWTEVLNTPDEEDVFKYMHVEYVKPENR